MTVYLTFAPIDPAAQMVWLFLFAAVVNPNVSAISVVTLLVLAMATLVPRIWPLTSLIILLWAECIVLSRLFFQLDLVNPLLETSLWDWIGLSKVPETARAGNYVQWEVYVIVACAMERSVRKNGHMLWPNTPREARYLFDSGATGFGGGLKARVNHCITLYGEQVCFGFTMFAMVVRRNVVSLVYFGCLLAMSRGNVSNRSRTSWRVQLFMVLLVVLYEVGCSLGLPPQFKYSYEGADHPLRVVLRWLFLPPNSAEDAPDFWNIAREPVVWLSSGALYLDFCVVFLHGLILRTASWKPEPSLTLAKVAIWSLSWLSCFLCFLVVLTRVDIFCIGFLGAGFFFLLRFNEFLADSAAHMQFWNRLQFYSVFVVFLHALWVLPALIVDWEDVSPGILGFVQVFGVRYGQGLRLLPGDPDVGVTAFASGLAVDVLLTIVVFCLRHVLETTDAARYASDCQISAGDAAARARKLPKAILKRVQDSQWREESQAEVSRSLLQKIRDRHNLIGTARLDETAAQLFSTAAIAKETSRIVNAEEAELHEADGETEGSGSGWVAHNEGVRRRKPTGAEDALPSTTAAHSEPTDTTQAGDVACEGGQEEEEKEERPSSLCSSLTAKLRFSLVTALANVTSKYEILWSEQQASETRRPDLATVETAAAYMEVEPASLNGAADVVPSSAVEAPGAEAPTTETSVLTQLGRYCALRTHWVCSILIVTSALVNRDLLAVILPLIMFGWGALSRPFASHRYWTFVLGYACSVLVLRYVFQFTFMGEWNAPVDPRDSCADCYLRSGCLTFARFVGIARNSDGPLPLTFLLPDLMLVVALGIHRAVLQGLGIWG